MEPEPKLSVRESMMRARIALGRCDTCGGPTRTMIVNDRPRTLCDGDGSCGFHEVGKRDGAPFSWRRAPARTIRIRTG